MEPSQSQQATVGNELRYEGRLHRIDSINAEGRMATIVRRFGDEENPVELAIQTVAHLASQYSNN